MGLLWCLATGLAFSTGGVRGSTFMAYLVIVVMAGLLLGGRAGVGLAALTALAGLGLVYAETLGRLPPPAALPTPLSAWFDNLSYIVVVVVVQALAARIVRETLTRARTSEAQYRMLFEEAFDGICITDADNRVLIINPAVQQMLGYTLAEVMGWPAADFIAPESLAELPAATPGQLRAIGPQQRERLLVRKDGSVVSAFIGLRPMPDGRFHYIVRDATQRKQAEEALRASEERFRLISSVSSDYVFSTQLGDDGHLHLHWVGGAFEAITGYTFDDYVARGGWPALLHPADREVDARDMAALHANQKVITEVRTYHKNGAAQWVRVYAHPVWDAERHLLTGIYGAVQDITQRKQAEDELQRLNAELEQRVTQRTAQLEDAVRELEAFSYSISHDLRAPLRAMDGFSRLLLEDYAADLPAEAQRYLGRVSEGAQRMGQLIDDLLAFSRLGRQALRFQTLTGAHLSALVRAVVDDLRAEAPERPVEVVVDELSACQADPALLKQVFVNLLSNAFKFTQPNLSARIEIGSGPTTEGPAYFVRDNGIGFDMRYAHKLFGVFQRLHSENEFEGAGVGLAIVQRIVQKHGGRSWAEAETGKGATFYFTLPENH